MNFILHQSHKMTEKRIIKFKDMINYYIFKVLYVIETRLKIRALRWMNIVYINYLRYYIFLHIMK